MEYGTCYNMDEAMLNERSQSQRPRFQEMSGIDKSVETSISGRPGLEVE